MCIGGWKIERLKRKSERERKDICENNYNVEERVTDVEMEDDTNKERMKAKVRK